jgi:hypothetical protein
MPNRHSQPVMFNSRRAGHLTGDTATYCGVKFHPPMSYSVYILSMPIAFEPWSSYPPLTLERLVTVASLMRDVRNEAVLVHDVGAGDSTWSLGCRIYSRTMATINRESLSTSWLRVLPESQALRFTFTIGSLPVKFYKGEPADIPGRCLVQSFAELKQMKLAFDAEGIRATHRLRLAVEADSFGNTTSITLVEVDDAGKPTRTFEIPLDTANVVVMRPKPINLNPPVLEVIKDTTKEVKREEAGGKLGAGGAKS